ARFLRLRSVPRIAERFVERDRFLRELAHDRSATSGACAQREFGRLVVAAGLQARLDALQALTAPKAEQHALVLSANEQNRPVRGIHEMSPLHVFFDIARSANAGAQVFDTGAPPT